MHILKDTLSRLLDFSKNHEEDISPQLLRKLGQLIDISDPEINLHNVHKLLLSIYNRLILELALVHQNTKQREQNMVRLIDKLGCSISEPELTDMMIALLVNLYKAASQCSDTSFERNALIKYLLKEVGKHGYNKRQVGKVLQTLYRCSCFDINKCDDAPSRFSLKSNLTSYTILRHHYDNEIIKLARSNNILLTPESWTYLLYRQSSPDLLARVQSILDKQRQSVTLNELQDIMSSTNDKFGLSPHIPDLAQIYDILHQTSLLQGNQQDLEENITLVLSKLFQLRHLFTMRRCRERRFRII